jgi:cytidylate kinase
MYRAVAWKAKAEGLDLADAAAVAAVAASATFEVNSRVAIDGEDVTDAIRTPAIDQAAAVVAQHPAVRAVLVERQRRYGELGGVVMEGRDIGSVVFPDADVKVYLDAEPGERARRRSADAAHAAGRAIGRDGVAEALEVRDRIDRTRTVSPLKMAPDAVYIDTTHLGIDDVVMRVMDLVEKARV